MFSEREPRRVRFDAAQRQYIVARTESLTDWYRILRPSEWAEENRYLPPSVTALPGPFSFDVCPYAREIVDCLSVDSPVREITWMKGAQIGATTALLENAIGYAIGAIQTAAVMLVTTDQDFAQVRMESNVTPMIQMSGLADRIQSADERNTRKTGKTDKKIEWAGGGYLLPVGAQNPNKFRQTSVQMLLRDEIDTWPDVAKEGDPLKLTLARTAGFEHSRKIVDVSTPTVKGQSRIEARFLRGDQRYYFVRCLRCGFEQILRWNHKPKPTGEVGGGIRWETDGGRLVPDSVRYECDECGHPHSNDDKTRLLSPEHGARWKPTAEPADPAHRSYHLSALYSPVGMHTWPACVHEYLDAWDTENNRLKDSRAFQTFYNTVLGSTYELKGEKLTFATVSKHRRNYHAGEIPNELAASVGGGPILLLTCAVDVHKTNLAVSVFGWSRNRRAWLIEYDRFVGNTENLEDAATWGRLRKLIEEREYIADDGKRYRVTLTCIDSGYRPDDVYQFAAEYEAGVVPVKGRDAPIKSVRDREFSDFTTPMGTRAYGIVVDFYKDRWSAALRRSWDGLQVQPEGHFNAPLDTTDKALRELTVETKREKVDPKTKERIGFEWHRPSGAANELWDCLIYASAGLDLVAWDYCRNQAEMEFVNWTAFYDHCEAAVDPRKSSIKPYYQEG